MAFSKSVNDTHVDPDMAELEHSHHPEAIRERLDEGRQPSYLRDAILGGIDGCVTTFAVVASVAGAGLPGLVAFSLGLASLIADGFSMGVSNYQGVKSDRDTLERARATENRHIRHAPDGEREEIRQIFARKGFAGDVLEEIVETISADKTLWVDTMLREEHGLELEGVNPVRAAVWTFAAFVLVGSVPLLPFMLPALGLDVAFILSSTLTAVTFFGIGFMKGIIVGERRFQSGLETLLMGGGAAIIAYLVGGVFEPMMTEMGLAISR
ncbi:MAG: VIT1/CCC1 transporter family protein [Spiribacter sp.]|jgi:VIT1/CCC1 family predicted Fe2+/Mn2+ transporter|nr:VIT1/CCC1 transporter family protein [Spiribacter sp.]MDR9489691.1 VIT1/CCC1 transporter family protein [Spiribacter sp.]